MLSNLTRDAVSKKFIHMTKIIQNNVEDLLQNPSPGSGTLAEGVKIEQIYNELINIAG